MDRNLRRHAAGLTLIEAVATLAALSLLLTVGASGARDLTARAGITGALNDFATHLHLARSEAVKRGYPTVLCPAATAVDCADLTIWDQGVLLFVDLDSDREHDPGEPLLRRFEAGSTQVRIHSTAGRKRVRFRPDGSAPGSNLTLTFCDRGEAVAPKALILSNPGRPRVSATKWDGTALSCT